MKIIFLIIIILNLILFSCNSEDDFIKNDFYILNSNTYFLNGNDTVYFYSCDVKYQKMLNSDCYFGHFFNDKLKLDTKNMDSKYSEYITYLICYKDQSIIKYLQGQSTAGGVDDMNSYFTNVLKIRMNNILANKSKYKLSSYLKRKKEIHLSNN